MSDLSNSRSRSGEGRQADAAAPERCAEHPATTEPAPPAADDEPQGGDPPCWAHLFWDIEDN